MKNRIFLVGMVVCCIMFYLLNRLILMRSDDLLYGFMFTQEHVNAPLSVLKDHPIQTVADIVRSQYNHYFVINGRIPVHAIVQLFCGILGKKVYDICAFIVFGLFILSLGKCVFPQLKGNQRFAYFIPFLVLFLFIKEPSCFYKVVACGVNYLWASVVCLYFWYLFSIKKELGKVEKCLLPVVAFFTGWSMEAIVIPMSIAVGVVWLLRVKEMHWAKHLSFYLFVIGTALLVFAPGNFVRAQSSVPFTLQTFKAFVLLTKLVPVYIFFAAGMLLLKRDVFVAWIKRAHVLALNMGLILSFALFAYLGPVALRVGYGLDLFAVILLCDLLSMTLPDSAKGKLGVLAYSLTCVLFVAIISCQRIASEHMNDAISQISKCKENECDLVLNYTPFSQPISRFVVQLDKQDELYFNWNLQIWEWYYDKKVRD